MGARLSVGMVIESDVEWRSLKISECTWGKEPYDE